MGEQHTPLPGTRQERRKAATRAKILSAAEQLFGERGYTETSIEEISELADVAVRTIYTHFPSKAAIMLAYFDEWVDAFIAEILKRPVDEPVVETIRLALAAMSEAEWVDRVESEDTRVHPLVEHLAHGSPDIAGHVLQHWMRGMEVLSADAAERGKFEQGALEPHARAVAVFSAWISAMSVARARLEGRALPPNSTGSSLGIDTIAIITSGKL